MIEREAGRALIIDAEVDPGASLRVHDRELARDERIGRRPRHPAEDYREAKAQREERQAGDDRAPGHGWSPDRGWQWYEVRRENGAARSSQKPALRAIV